MPRAYNAATYPNRRFRQTDFYCWQIEAQEHVAVQWMAWSWSSVRQDLSSDFINIHGWKAFLDVCASSKHSFQLSINTWNSEFYQCAYKINSHHKPSLQQWSVCSLTQLVVHNKFNYPSLMKKQGECRHKLSLFWREQESLSAAGSHFQHWRISPSFPAMLFHVFPALFPL